MNIDFTTKPTQMQPTTSQILLAGSLAAHAAETLALLSTLPGNPFRPQRHRPLPPDSRRSDSGLVITTTPPSGAAPRSIHLVSLAEPAAAEPHEPALLAWISQQAPDRALGILVQDLQGAWVDHHARVMLSRNCRLESYRLPRLPILDSVGYAVAIAAARLIHVPEIVVRRWLGSRTPLTHPARTWLSEAA